MLMISIYINASQSIYDSHSLLTQIFRELNQSNPTDFFLLLYLITGVLACLDGYMNIALDQTEEYANGQLKNKYGDAFIRGNNVLYISTQKRRV